MVIYGIIKWSVVIFFIIVAAELLQPVIGVKGMLGVISACVAYSVAIIKINK